MAKKEKTNKSKGRKAEFEPNYIRALCIDIYKDELIRSGGKSRNDYEGRMKELVAKYGSKERAEQRFNEEAQIYAPHVRMVFRAMQLRGHLPKEAE